MLNEKPYLSFTFGRLAMTSFLMKKAAEKNAELMRSRTIEEHREAMQILADARLISPMSRFKPAFCNGVSCEWAYTDSSDDSKVILYIHGGSWAYGNLDTARPVGMFLNEVTGLRTLIAQYRLSPEHPYPAAPNDCMAVYKWLLEQGYESSNIALFGDSAGGNLCLSLIHRLIENNMPLPAAVALASPATDLSETSELYRGSPDLLFTQHEGKEQNVFDLYTNGNDVTSKFISPIYGDLEGFPPLMIHVGGDEELCVDCDVFAAKAYKAGVDVALKIYRNMYHDFSIVGITLKESRQSLKEFGAFITKHLKV